MVASDWPEVERIYRAGIETGNATFETKPPLWEEWDAIHLPDLRFVAAGPGLVGWTAAKRVSNRNAYRGVVEESVYIDPGFAGRGLGRLLLAALIEASEQLGYWTIQTGIFPENKPSIALHEKVGFRLVGTQELVGESNGLWRDVALMERRSPVAGRESR